MHMAMRSYFIKLIYIEIYALIINFMGVPTISVFGNIMI
jgi:hypothetical protein